MTEGIYSVEEAAELLGLTTSGVSLYHRRYKNIGIVKKIKGCPKGRLYFSESDITFMRERVGKKGKESKYTAGEIVGTWRLLERSRKAGGNRIAYLVECVKCGFKKELASSEVSDIATGKHKNKCKECARLVKEQEAQWIKEMGKLHGRSRCSGRTYENSPERLAEIKEKYKNGVTSEILAEWLGRV